MSLGKLWQSKVILIPLLSLSVFLLPSCVGTRTYTPPPIVDTQPSWDGNKQNSGIISYDVESGNYHITANAASRYNALIDKYGDMFLPKLKKGDGLTKKNDGTYLISTQHLIKFGQMNIKHKESRVKLQKIKKSWFGRLLE
ncbi:MAG: hypothetical protein DWQ49_09595 [Bacteroidetes bacterium]|nr:MAG: hypothetical protein DWQ49_09595 [Bacteroidota bacterium]